MDANIRGADEAIGPPRTGYAAEYERLLIEELSLQESQNSYIDRCKKSTTNNDEQESIDLKIRAMVHRASLEGMLLVARHAADEARSEIIDVDAPAKYEQGLERSDAKAALVSLWKMKSRQLEDRDNRIPISIDEDALACRRRRYISKTKEGDADIRRSVVRMEANVNDFFTSFPECRRRDTTLLYPEMDESDSDDDDESIDEIIPKAKIKQKRGVDGPIEVSCSSTSPSPEIPEPKKVARGISSDALQNQKQSPPNISQLNISHEQYPQSSNTNQVSGQSRNNCPTNPYQIQSQYQHSQPRPPTNEYTHNPFQRQHQEGPQQIRQQNDHYHHHNSYQNQPLAFDYDDNNSYGKSGPVEKKNSFITAKELVPICNDKSQAGNRGEGDRYEEDWDNYGGQCGGGANNSRSISSTAPPSRPAQMVQAAIRGPKDNLSAGLKRKFQPPIKRGEGGVGGNNCSQNTNNNNNGSRGSNSTNRNTSGGGNGGNANEDEELPEELRGLDKELIEKINNEIVDSGEQVTFNDIAGLKHAKATVNELVIMPMKRPDLFTGLRACPKGLLLFGPPGTGKTLIGKAIAHESGATFFSISSSSLTSKWIGEGEKLVRTLFAVASYRAPSVIFIDEVDSMLTQRKSDENEASRRIKTEFLVQLDGAGNGRKGQVLVIGATNLPQELDDAARRRFVKKLYIPLPDQDGREQLIANLLEKNDHTVTKEQLVQLAKDSVGFSGADLKILCTEAAMGPLRKFGAKAMDIDSKDVPPISYKHFRQALKQVNPSVAEADLVSHIEWNNTYGSLVGPRSDDDSSQDSDAGSVES